MRVISGKYRGRLLVAFKGDHLRPTTDRVKETIFNKLMHRIPESRVLDLFSGTGNLSIEALSRGAQFVLMVESHRKSLQIIKKNFENLSIERDFELRSQDVFSFIKSYQGEGFDIVFADPPFTKKIAHEVMLALSQVSWVGAEVIVVIEASTHERLEPTYSGFKCLDILEFGDKRLALFQREVDSQ